MGLSFEELFKSRPDQQFKMIADGIARTGDVGTKASVAMEIFGRAGLDLLPTLSMGSAGLDAFTAKQVESGKALTDAGMSAVEAAKDALPKVSDAFTGLWDKTVVAIAPAIQAVGDFVTMIADKLTPAFNRVARAMEQVFGKVDTSKADKAKKDREDAAVAAQAQKWQKMQDEKRAREEEAAARKAERESAKELKAAKWATIDVMEPAKEKAVAYAPNTAVVAGTAADQALRARLDYENTAAAIAREQLNYAKIAAEALTRIAGDTRAAAAKPLAPLSDSSVRATAGLGIHIMDGF